MKKIEVKIYKSEDGTYSLTNEPEKLTPSIRDLYQLAHPEIKWDDLTQKQRRGRAYRFGKSELYKELVKQNETVRVFQKFGIANIEFDGRINERRIPFLILEALKEGRNEIKYYPESNKNKPPHLQKVYVKEFSIK